MQFILAVCVSLTVLQVDMPAYVVVGSNLDMECKYDLEDKTLYRLVGERVCLLMNMFCYSIKWFHNKSEILSYRHEAVGEGVTTITPNNQGVDIKVSIDIT